MVSGNDERFCILCKKEERPIVRNRDTCTYNWRLSRWIEWFQVNKYVKYTDSNVLAWVFVQHIGEDPLDSDQLW